MPVFWLILIVLAIAATGYVVGRSRALASAGGDSRILHSLPSYYGLKRRDESGGSFAASSYRLVARSAVDCEHQHFRNDP